MLLRVHLVKFFSYQLYTKPNPCDKLAKYVKHHILQVVIKARHVRSPVQKTATDRPTMMVSIE